MWLKRENLIVREGLYIRGLGSCGDGLARQHGSWERTKKIVKSCVLLSEKPQVIVRYLSAQYTFTPDFLVPGSLACIEPYVPPSVHAR